MRSVSQSEVPQSPFLWTRGIAARETLSYLDRKGIDAEPLLLKVELSRGRLSQDPGGISFASQHRFLELAATETNNSLLGLHVAAEMDVRAVGILFYLAASSATVAEALEHLVRYVGTTSEAVRLEISQHKDETVLTAHPVLALDEPCRQFSEFSALAVIRALQRLTNRNFAARRITFAHPRNSSLREIHGILRCPVEFAQATDSWVISKRHGTADSLRGQSAAAHTGGPCRRLARGEAYRGRTAGLSGKSAPRRASQRQGTGSGGRPAARHERAVVHAAPRAGGHKL
jgi:hypothetical protein